MIGLDANVLARYYVASPDQASQQQSQLARQLIEGGKRLFVCKSVLLELEWLLRAYYKSSPADVLTVLLHLLSMPNIEIEDRIALEMASEALADGFDFADTLHHASCRLCRQMVSFDDKKFAQRAALKDWQPPVRVLG